MAVGVSGSSGGRPFYPWLETAEAKEWFSTTVKELRAYLDMFGWAYTQRLQGRRFGIKITPKDGSMRRFTTISVLRGGSKLIDSSTSQNPRYRVKSRSHLLRN